MEYHQRNESVKQKKIGLAFPGKKLGFPTELCEFRELQIFVNFKNSSFSSSQGVIQIKPNSVWSITSKMTV